MWVDNIKMHLIEVGWGDVSIRIGTGGKLLLIRYGTFGLYEILGNYRVASRVLLSSIELVKTRWTTSRFAIVTLISQ
jgi:hypothetical protein